MTTHADSRERQYPLIGLWSLASWYKELKSAILELESAYERSELPAALLHPDYERTVGSNILEVYRRLVSRDPPNEGRFRRAGVHKILEPIRHLLQPCDRIFDATVERPDGRVTGIVIAAADGAPEIRMRLGQLVAARAWKVGFRFDDPKENQFLASSIVQHVALRLESDLTALGRLQGRYRSYVGGEALLVPDQVGLDFEQLMIDVLNEDRTRARRATLDEDVLEQTDLRYRAPGINRKRGARVQVTRTFNRNYHAEKIGRLRRSDEYVVLSPRSLAQAVSGQADLLDDEQRTAFWGALPGRPADVDHLASDLRAMFDTAMKQAQSDPRGALAAVPSPVRSLIRRFVHADAARSVLALRARLDAKPAKRN